MAAEKENQERAVAENEVSHEQPVAETKKEWKRIFNQQWLVRNLGFFLFLTALAIIYIYNGHYAETTIKDINKTARELKELQYEYKTVKGELMMRGKQSELAKAVESIGLKELKEPPTKIGDSLSTGNR